MSEQQKKIYEGLDALASKLGSEEREELAGLVRTITTSRPAEATRAAGRWLKANDYEER